MISSCFITSCWSSQCILHFFAFLNCHYGLMNYFEILTFVFSNIIPSGFSTWKILWTFLGVALFQKHKLLKIISIYFEPPILEFLVWQCDIWRANSTNLYKIFTGNSQDYQILFIVKTWQVFIKFWNWSYPILKNFHHLVWDDPGAIHFDLLWNLEDPVLIQTLSYRRKMTYYLRFILIGFFHS